MKFKVTEKPFFLQDIWRMWSGRENKLAHEKIILVPCSVFSGHAGKTEVLFDDHLCGSVGQSNAGTEEEH